VERGEKCAAVILKNGEQQTFDKVIFASHADETVSMLAEATTRERTLLTPFHYQENVALLHTDETVMPKTKRTWSSWNYRIDQEQSGKLSPATIYWMNSLQQVSKKRNYFVNINGEERVNPQSVVKRIVYTHPVFSVDALKAQKDLPSLNQSGPVYFCGSYFRYGFHEDAFASAVDLCSTILKKNVWE
jgi:predicted NAD/FAD-binding protein